MRIRVLGMVLAVLAAGMAFSCAEKDARMTLGDFMGLCVSGASDDCRDVCDEFAGVFVKTYPTSAQCRKACDAVQERLARQSVGMPARVRWAGPPNCAPSTATRTVGCRKGDGPRVRPPVRERHVGKAPVRGRVFP
jgi:hypothetical protein